MDGKAYLIISKTGLFTIDINGQMDDQDTGRLPDDGHHSGYYEGPPIHTLTIFANSFLDNKPSLDDPGVYLVTPGEEATSEGSWHTLYFLPGVHDVGASFRLHANKSYYIPGDAIVYGTMNNFKDGDDGNGILIYGHGTLSGDRLPHPHYANPPIPDDEHWRYHGINIEGILKNLIMEYLLFIEVSFSI